MSKNHLAMIDIDLRKLDGFRKAIGETPSLLKEELGKAVTELVLVIEAKAKEVCPVDTGKLRASITPVVQSWAEAYVGTNTVYAPYVEFGTRKMAAQPFLEPAFMEGKRQAPAIFQRAINRAMTQLGRESR
jgi:HK97 gp10 family phage protein